MAGVLGQEGLLAQYAGGPVVPGAIGAGGVYACCTTWMSLAGVWATNPGYGYEILSVYKEMLAWALAQEEQQAGLLPAASPATTPASVSTSGGVSPSPSG
jgi:hypothetical protein